MSVEDFWTSVKATLYDRTSSPLGSALLLSWCAVNFKLFLIALSGIEIVPKLALIDKHMFPADGTWWLNLLAYPALGAAFWLLLFPRISRPVYGWWVEQQQELEALRAEKEKKKLLTLEKSQKLFADMARIRAEHQAEVENLQGQIDGLLAENERLKGKSANPSSVTFVDRDTVQHKSHRGLELPEGIFDARDQPSSDQLEKVNPRVISSPQHNELGRPQQERDPLKQAVDELKDEVSKAQFFADLVPESEKSALYRIATAKRGYEGEIFGHDTKSEDYLRTIGALVQKQLINEYGSRPNRIFSLTPDGDRAVLSLRLADQLSRHPKS